MKLSEFFLQQFFRRAQHDFQLLFRAICVSVAGTSLELIIWAQVQAELQWFPHLNHLKKKM